jgi:hypothetical protein
MNMIISSFALTVAKEARPAQSTLDDLGIAMYPQQSIRNKGAAAHAITLGGRSVQADGTLPAPAQTAVTVGGSTLDVTAHAGSAAILTLTP